MRRHLLFLGAILIVFTFFWSCQNSQLPVEQSTPPGDLQLNKLVLPEGATVTSAVLYLYAFEANDEQTVNVHRVTEEWIEEEVTWIDRITSTNWGTAGGSFDPNVEASFVPAATGWVSVDVTVLVQKWINDPMNYPNYGLLLKQNETSETTRYYSREGLEPPYVEITYDATSATLTGADLPDAFIRSTDINPLGTTDRLVIGNISDSPKKRVLIKFDIESTPDDNGDGCTLTPGYWKTHSKYGPAPFDETWNEIGEDSDFFLSGQSYYQVLWTDPKGGNAYYILASAYIAAELNQLNDADFTDAQDVFDQATDLFNTYTPDEVGSWKGGKHPMKEERDLFIYLAGILDDYNNGRIGPGHCE
jgi:hypothetical protein